MQIVDARPEHAEAVARIYGDVVRTSPATFDLVAPDREDWVGMAANSDPGLGHFMIVALGDSGEVLGFAKSAKFRDRAAYDTTCETSIYIDSGARGRGIGKALYQRLIELLEASPARLAVGGFTEPNEASQALHEALGFERVGTFKGVGFKFDQLWDVTWYQRPLD